MRFTVARAAERGVDAEPDLRLDGAQHAVRGRPLRPLPARPDAGLPRRAGLRVVRARAVADDPGAVMERGGKPKLAVWKFASCDGCQLSAARLRGRAARARRPSRDRLLPRGLERDRRRGPTTSRSSRARSRPPTTPSGSSEVRGEVARRSSRSARARPRAGSRRCATSPTSSEFTRRRLRVARVHLDARDLDADHRPRAGRLRAARLPDRQAPAARGDQRPPDRPPAPRSRRTASASSASAAARSA